MNVYNPFMEIKELFHSDCGQLLNKDGKCLKCKIVPDMQSIEVAYISTPEQLLDAALTQVDSKSIKEWVGKQRDIWIKFGATPIFEDSRADKVARLHLLIICEAIGL